MSENNRTWDQLSLDFGKEDIEAIIEVLLFVSSEPLSEQQIIACTGSFYSEKEIRNVILKLSTSYDERHSGLQILEVANGFRMGTRSQFDHIIRRYKQEKKKIRLSLPALETLAIIAYRQPITTPEIEAIRGVTVSAIVKNLLEKRLIKIIGRKKAAGKPLIYGTTRDFLEYFGLNDLSALPTLEEFYETFDEEQPSQLHIDEFVDAASTGQDGNESDDQCTEPKSPSSDTDTDDITPAETQTTDLDQ